MRKIEFTEEQIAHMIKMYNEEMVGTPTISERFGVSKRVINRTLKENGVVMGPSGRKFKAGKKVADKRWIDKNKKYIKKYYKEWSKDNRDYLREKHTEWREENREHVRAYAREYERKKCAEDPRYKLSKRTRTAVYTCLKEANISKYRSTFSILGYGIDELMEHLEKQFVDGMTWDNYGEWHVDHKKPMSSFSFKSVNDIEFKECWALNNLQPLWGEDNLVKGSNVL
jgi:hypothetical protein